MSKLRNAIRDETSARLVPTNIASYLAREMLNNLKDIHALGYVHRDVKPANFVRKNKKTNKFCTIDFGLAKLVSICTVCYYGGVISVISVMV
jgi:serine/threonine protein kinase